ncbi:MAG: putative TIM-barrel fold metal-dependent hydrolase [Glaciecola sp.]|jgi:predicted TIM-barrel fold metal-dependent hydrolase
MTIIDFRVRLPEEVRPAATIGDYGRYDEVLGVEASRQRTTADLLEDLRANDISHAVVHAEYEHGDIADGLNEAVGILVDQHSDLLSGFGTVSLDDSNVSRLVSQVRRCEELGLVGINVQPAFFGRAIDDRELYAVYGAADEAGLMVAVHTGVNYDRSRPIDGEHPNRLDRVASNFRDLCLIACHAAWPWTTELVAVARRHPTVHFDFGGLAPRYLGEPDTGWSTLFRMTDTLLREQALFATDWPVFGTDRALEQWRALPLRDASLKAVLGGNAASLLGDRRSSPWLGDTQ